MNRTAQMLDVARIREDFPILKREIHPGVPLVYLDSAATSQKPQSVLDAMTAYYRTHNANIHRGIHTLAVEATEDYENARKAVADFLDAGRPEEIIFTRNATESINLVMQTWGRANLQTGDTVLLSELEHHSNIIPWQILAKEKGLHLEFVPLTADGELDLTAYLKLLEREPRLVSMTQMSNVMGSVIPLEGMIQAAHKVGALFMVDGAQAAAHFPVRMAALDADFYALSGHKMCGPTGIGILYGKWKLLNDMPPFMGGGEMIRKVEWTDFETNEVPHKFEAGTPAVAEAVGLGAAVHYLQSVGLDSVHAHEKAVTGYALERLQEIPGLQILGPELEKRGGLVAFTLEDIHPHDIAQILDARGIAVRAGHHCAMPLHNRLGISASTRASFYLYTTIQEIDLLAEGLLAVKRMFA